MQWVTLMLQPESDVQKGQNQQAYQRPYYNPVDTLLGLLFYRWLLIIHWV
jgi:hypothetical protein